jgi:hypothetical protein
MQTTTTNKTRNPEQGTWKAAKNDNGILIKKACEHLTCSHYRCERTDLKVGAIAI